MNRVLTTHLDSEFYFPLYKARYLLLQKLLEAEGESSDKYIVLAPDCSPSHYKVQEMRKHKFVCFYIEAYNAGADPATLPDITSCEDLDVSSIELA